MTSLEGCSPCTKRPLPICAVKIYSSLFCPFSLSLLFSFAKGNCLYFRTTVNLSEVQSNSTLFFTPFVRTECILSILLIYNIRPRTHNFLKKTLHFLFSYFLKNKTLFLIVVKESLRRNRLCLLMVFI